MKRMWDFECTGCEKVVEKFVEADKQDLQMCDCGCPKHMKRLPAVIACWSPSESRTHGQLKVRSDQHMKDCVKKDMHPDDSVSGKGDARWRNKRRAKNTSKSTISNWQNVHKKWAPGRYYTSNGTEVKAD